MKIKYFITLLIVSLAFTANAQFTVLHAFTNTDGNYPRGSLISDGTFLYGMTNLGGAAGSGEQGVIFKIKPDGTGYSVIWGFDGTASGALPFGSLLYDGTYLYGMTSGGGANNYGVIFKIKTDGTGYVNMHDFSVPDAASPSGSLITDGTYLYGMAQLGAAHTLGAIFKIKKDGTGYAHLYDFTIGTDGRQPFGSLVSDGTYMYGLGKSGGTLDSGTVFKIKPDGTGYATVLNFTGANGSSPTSTLIYDGTYLYGMTMYGGINNSGVIFKIRPDGTGYAKLLDFNGTNGQYPFLNSLVLGGGYLYGMTERGGTSNGGVIFEIKTDGTGYSKLLDLDASTGDISGGSLYYEAAALYGLTGYDGSGGYGTLFRLGLVTGINENTLAAAVSVYPNPAGSVFNLKVEQAENLKINAFKIYDVAGKCVYEKQPEVLSASTDFKIDLSGQPAGVYFINLQTDKGTLVKKIEKE